MKKNFFNYVLCLLALPFVGTSVAQAQGNAVAVIETITVEEVQMGKKHYYENCFANNWEMSLGAGAQIFFDDKMSDPKFTAAFSAGVDKWLTPYVGLRIAGLAGMLTSNNVANANDQHKFRYWGVYGDMLWNLTNTFWGYNETRVFSLIPFVGIGYNYTYHYKEKSNKTHNFPITGGLKFNFRVSKHIDLYLEARANVLGAGYNAIVPGDVAQSVVSGIGGITYKFGTSGFRSYDPAMCKFVVQELNNNVNTLRAALNECNARECPPCPEVIAVEVVETMPNCIQKLTSSVRFAINKSDITAEEMVNVYNVAEWAKQNPTCRVRVMGFADKKTGTAKFNQELSWKRAHAVAKILNEKYGIDKTRIDIEAEGSTNQPYPNHNNWNRVVVFGGEN